MSRKHLSLMLCAALVALGTLPLLHAQDSTFDALPIAFIGKSGDNSPDRGLYQAAVLAAEQLNAGDDDDEAGIRAGDNKRYRFDVKYYAADTADDVTTLLSDVVDDESIAILGPQDVKAAQGLDDADRKGLPALLGASNAPTASDFFHLVAAPKQRVQAAEDYLVNQRHFTKIALVAVNTTDSQDGLDSFKAASGASVIALTLTHEADETDFSADVKQMRDKDVDALYVWTLDAPMLALLQALNKGGWHGTIVYEGLDAAFVAQAGDMANGLVGVVPWTPDAYDDESHTFVSDYTKRWGEAPSADAAAAYDAVYLLAAAVSKSDPTASAVKTALSQLADTDGVIGTYRKGQSSALRIITAGESFSEIVRYDSGACVDCPDTWWADSSSDTASKQETFRIGLITTLDGSAQARGDQMAQAARLAIRDINDAGGIVSSGTRYTLDLLSYSAATADETSTAFDQAVKDGVDVILGPDYNAQILPNLHRAEDAGLVQLVSATVDQISTNESANYVFQMRTADRTLAEAAAHYLLHEREFLHIATVAARTDYGLDASAAFKDVINADEDADITLELDHDIDQTDFAEMAAQINAANVEAVAVWTSQPAALSLLKELNSLNWKGVFVYGYITPEFTAKLSQDSSIEVIGPVSWDASARDWVSQDFTARYQDRYGDTPIAQAAAYYDAVHLIGRGLEAKGTSGLRDWLINLTTFRGVQGVYAPNAYDTGELTRTTSIIQVQPQTLTLAQYEADTCVMGCKP